MVDKSISSLPLKKLDQTIDQTNHKLIWSKLELMQKW